MLLNLRQAHAVQSELQKLIKDEIPKATQDTFRLDEFSDVKYVILQKEKESKEKLEKIYNLIGVLYTIRLKIKTANVESGVEEHLSYLESLKDTMHLYSAMSSLTPRSDLENLNGRASKMRKSTENTYQLPLTSGVFPKETLDEYASEVRNIKKKIRKVNDNLVELNITNHIELTDSDVEVLENFKLL